MISGAGNLTIGADLQLSGTNTFSGNALLNNGAALTIGSSGALGAGGTFTIDDGTLQTDGSDLDIDKNLQLNGDFGLGAGGNITILGTTSLGDQGDDTFNFDVVDGLALILGDEVTDTLTVADANDTIIKTGAGALGIYSQNAVLNNDFALTEGTLIIGADDALGNGGTFTIGGAQTVFLQSGPNPEPDPDLDPDNFDATPFVLTKNIVVTGDFGLTENADGLTDTGDIALCHGATYTLDFGGAAREISVADGLQLFIAGEVNNGVGITKSGDGSLVILDDLNGFTGGFDVNGGNVLVGPNATLGAATNTFDLADGTGLGASGGAVTLDQVYVIRGDLNFLGDDTLTLEQSAGAGVIDLTTNRDPALALLSPTPQVTVNQDATVVFNDPTVSSSGIIVNGPGTLQLAQDNPALTGNVRINSGTLQLNAPTNAVSDTALVTINQNGTLELLTNETIGQFTGSGTISLTGTTLRTRGSQAGSFIGVIEGTGGLDLGGLGLTTLSGSNTFQGDTRLTRGTLVLANNNALGDGTGSLIAAGGGLRSNGVARTFTNGLDFDGNLSVLEGGDLTFNGDGNVQNAANPFQLSVAANTTFTLAGDMTSVGGGNDITKTGAGTWSLTGDNSAFVNTINHQQGTLSVTGVIGGGVVSDAVLTGNGDINGSVTLRNRSRLTGAPTIAGDLVAQNGSTINPGIQTISVGGDYTQRGGANFVVTVNKATNDAITNSRILLTGGDAAFQSGATVEVRPASGSRSLSKDDQFAVITANGGSVNAALSANSLIADSSFLLDFQLIVEGNQLLVTTIIDDNLVSDLGGNDNASSAGASIDEIIRLTGDVPPNEFIELLLNTGDPRVIGQALDAMPPTPTNEATNTVVRMPSIFTNTLSSYLSRQRAGIPTLATLNQRVEDVRPSDTQLASLAATPELLQSVAASQSRRPGDGFRYYPEEEGGALTPWSAFARGYAVFSEVDADTNRTGSSSQTFGGQVGADYTFEDANLAVGGTIAIAASQTDFDGNAGDADVLSFRGGAYASWYTAPWWLDGSLSFGYHNTDSNRRVAFPGFDETYTAEYDSFDVTLALNAGYDWVVRDVPGLILTPRAGVVYTFLSQEDFVEDGDRGANLAVDAVEESYADILGSFNATYVYTNQVNRHTYVSEAGFGLRYRAVGDETEITARLDDFNVPFTTTADNGDPLAPFVDLGFTWVFDQTNSVFFRYNGEFPSDSMTHSIQAGYVTRF